MRAIFIDTITRTVTEIQTEDDLLAYYKLIGCRTIEVAGYFPNQDCIYCDENGLTFMDRGFFNVPGVTFQPIAGRGLIVGSDDEGGTVDSKTTLEEVERLVEFYSLMELKDKLAKEPEIF